MVGTLLSARQAAAQQIRSAQGGPAPAQPAPAQQPAQQPAPAQRPAPAPQQQTQPAAVRAYRRSRHRLLKTLAAMAAGAAILTIWQHRHDYAIVRADRGTPTPRTTMQVYHDTNAGFREAIYDGGVSLDSAAEFFSSAGNMIRSATGAYSDLAAASSRVKTVVASARADRAVEEARGAKAKFGTAWDELTLADRRQSMRERSVREADRHADSNLRRTERKENLAAQRRRETAEAARRRQVEYDALVARTRGDK
ncbi:MAG: hypothetical protein II942_01255 [Alphaproteobacteria bacterium]|nr:hypothetical protein [Alphaproteobacteria bacterium]